MVSDSNFVFVCFSVCLIKIRGEMLVADSVAGDLNRNLSIYLEYVYEEVENRGESDLLVQSWSHHSPVTTHVLAQTTKRDLSAIK